MQDSKYLAPEASQQELLSHLDPVTLAEWSNYGHLRIEAAFQDRVFVVYECMGRNSKNVQRPPNILAKLRVISFVARDETGCVLRLLNETTNVVEEISHVPRKVFGFPIFMAIPAQFALKWDAHPHGAGVRRSLSYVVFVKARNKAEFMSKGNVYCEVPNKMREKLYPHVELKELSELN